MAWADGVWADGVWAEGVWAGGYAVRRLIVAEFEDRAVGPGRLIRHPNPLNQGDAVTLALGWAAWLGSETLSSAAWEADNALTLSAETSTSTEATALVTASDELVGWYTAQCQITSSAGRKRSVGVSFEIVNFR